MSQFNWAEGEEEKEAWDYYYWEEKRKNLEQKILKDIEQGLKDPVVATFKSGGDIDEFMKKI